MRRILQFATSCLVLSAIPALPQGQTPTEASAADMIAGTAATKYVSPRRAATFLVATNGVKRMHTAGDLFGDLSTPNFTGQIGVTWNGANNFALWPGNNGGFTNANWSFPTGIDAIGDITRMRTNMSQTLAIYHNGNAVDSSYNKRITRNGSYLFHWNLNPFTDGNMMSFPMVTTNESASYGVTGLTNAEGSAIRVRDNFGLTLGSIPHEYHGGIADLAGTLDIIAGVGPEPLCISENYDMGGEAGTGASQHSWVQFEKPGKTHFGAYINGIHLHSQVGWKDLLKIDHLAREVDLEGYTQFWTNVNFRIPVGQAVTFDFTSAARLGFVLPSGDYSQVAHASGSPFKISGSTSADLQASLGTITPEVTVSNNTMAVGKTTPAKFGATLDVGGAGDFTGVLTVRGNVITNGNSVWYDRTNAAPPTDANHIYFATSTNNPGVFFVWNGTVWSPK